MERLTFDGNFCDIAQCIAAPCRGSENCAQKQVWERLKAYEDTRRTPEEITAYRWIPVAERLPDPETEVLAVCNRGGCILVVPAIYEDGTVSTENSIWIWNEIGEYGRYSEELDDYFIPVGWWENRQFIPDDSYNCPVEYPVTHWMPLPKAPEVK